MLRTPTEMGMRASKLWMCWQVSNMNECFKLYKAAHACTKGPKFVRPLAGVFRHLSQFLFACHIGSQAEIGDGCLFQHNGVGCVISEKAVIGKNCEFYQHVTVGTLRGGVPIIEDDVSIGANAVLLGNIVIHKGAKIGAGAVVLCDVPESATAVGVPARIIMTSEM